MGKVCEKCNGVIPENQPICTNAQCLTMDVIGTGIGEKGGFLTHIVGYKYPYKGSPGPHTVAQVASVKRAIITAVKMIASFPFILLLPFAFFVPQAALKKVAHWISDLYRADLLKKQMQDEEFCDSGREILRAGKALIARVNWNELEKGWLVDVLYCLLMFWDFDGAYRFRGQDAVGIADKRALLANPRKEVSRILKVIAVREHSDNVNLKMVLVRRLVAVTIFLSPTARKLIKVIAKELDFEKVKLDESDYYWTSDRWDYDFLGEPYNERMATRKTMEIGWDNKPPNALALANISVSPNGYFFKLTLEQATENAHKVAEQLIAVFKLKNEIK